MKILEEKGSITVLTALVMVAVFGMTALAVDAGYLYFMHTRLQDIADATALAAAHEIVKTNGNENSKRSAAFTKAQEYVAKHGLTKGSSTGYTTNLTNSIGEAGRMTVSFPDGVSKVKVDLEFETGLFFARVLDNHSTLVGVSSTAVIGQVGEQTGNILPICFFWDSYEPWVLYQLSLDPGNGVSGNYGFLDYPGPQTFLETLLNGYTGTLSVEQEVETYPGASVGQITRINDRINSCTNGCYVDPDSAEPDHTEEDCPRVVVIPVVEHFFDANGKSMVTIRAFAKFFLEGYDRDEKLLTGYFMEEVSTEQIVGSYTEFAIQSIRLIE